MYTNTKITLYRLILGKYERVVVNAFWSETKVSSFNKTGLSTGHTATVMIPYAESVTELTFSTGKDFAVKGECNLEIDCTDERTKSESIKALKDCGAVTAMLSDKLVIGSKDMWHYKLSCK